MSFTDVFIKRPVLSISITLLLVIAGAASLFKLSIRQWPKIEVQVISVNVAYTGASAELMESFVTTPLEQSLGGVPGLDYMTSESSQGSSSIVLTFPLGYDINTALADVSNAVNAARYQLPQNIQDPVISKSDPQERPIMYIAFSSTKMKMEDITNYLKTSIQPEMETLPGVAQANILGNLDYAMRLWLNPYAMAAHNITAADIQQALYNKNVQAAAGSIQTKQLSYPVNIKAMLSEKKQFNDLVIKNQDGILTRISDVADVELGAENYQFSIISDGKKTTMIGVTNQTGSNPLTISKEVRKLLAEKEKMFPEGLTTSIAYDSTIFIKDSLHEVGLTMILTIACVIVVIFLFLGSFRALLIPIVTIPISLITVCLFLLWLGYSINTLTLLAMVLAIGMVVDDAIVVSENSYRHIEKGQSSMDAALSGAREIVFAVIGMTITLAAVLVPIAFTSGVVGALFKQFAFTLAVCVIISGWIALTLSPMMSSRLLSKKTLNGWLPKKISWVTDKMAHGYHWIIDKLLRVSYLMVLIMIGGYVGLYFLFVTTKKELAPQEDVGAIAVIASAPTGANIKYTEKYTKKIPEIFDKIPEKKSYLMINGFNGQNSALSILMLKPWSERNKSVNEIIKELFPKLLMITGIRAFPVNLFKFPGQQGGFQAVGFVVTTLGSYEDLYQVMAKLMQAARKNPNLTNIDSNLKYNESQVNVHINRNLADELNVPVSNIGTSLGLALGGPTTTYFQKEGRAYPVVPQLANQYRQDPNILNVLSVRTGSGDLIPLENVTTRQYTIQPQGLSHFQQLRSATLSASLAPGYTQEQATTFLINAIEKLHKPGISYNFSGGSRQYMETKSTLLFAGILSVLFIFLVLAAQFESFRDPFIILITVPLSMIGALFLLKLDSGSINIYTEIGLLTLVGLISKHGILMVEFANQLQEEKNLSIREAILEASKIRLRPILMTTFAMILGALPLALASGAGAISRQQLGWVIVGGMAFGTLFTLFILPSVYYYIASNKQPHNEKLNDSAIPTDHTLVVRTTHELTQKDQSNRKDSNDD